MGWLGLDSVRVGIASRIASVLTLNVGGKGKGLVQCKGTGSSYLKKRYRFEYVCRLLSCRFLF